MGMPGSGKTTVGKRLAKAMGYDFIDLDQYIEKRGLDTNLAEVSNFNNH